MKSERVQEQIHARFVVRSEVDTQGLAAARLLDSHLPGIKLNIMFPGFMDDSVAELLVGVRSFEPDARGGLRRNIMQVGLQF